MNTVPKGLQYCFWEPTATLYMTLFFCQRYNRLAPYAVLLQDHGFGGYYSNFGAGGVMEKIAQATKVLPEWLIVGPHTQA